MPYLIAAITLVTLGAGIGWNLAPDTPDNAVEPLHITSDTSSSELKAIETKLNELILQLENERQARQALQKTVARLSSSFERRSDADATDETPVIDNATTAHTPNMNFGNMTLPEPVDAQQTLLALGLDNAEIETLEKRTEQQEMEQLYLQNQARREGWYGTRRYFEESRKLESNTNIYREELGDDRYDKYLFQSGQNNRVIAQSIISGSPAEQTGMQAGDIIYRYGDKRIFSWNDLTSATADGDPQQVVRLEIIRDGQMLEFYMKRGPLGIRLGSDRVSP